MSKNPNAAHLPAIDAPIVQWPKTADFRSANAGSIPARSTTPQIGWAEGAGLFETTPTPLTCPAFSPDSIVQRLKTPRCLRPVSFNPVRVRVPRQSPHYRLQGRKKTVLSPTSKGGSVPRDAPGSIPGMKWPVRFPSLALKFLRRFLLVSKMPGNRRETPVQFR